MVNDKKEKQVLVTVNILSFNRKDELRFTLTKVFKQDYKNIEVIVVDNTSSDGTQQMVKTEFPDVNLIELNENIGIAGWNKGFEVAKGEYVLVLDDDSYPENGTIESGVEILESDEQVAVVGFTIFNSYFNLIENKQEYLESKKNIVNTLGFIGCGAIIRKKYFLELGGFEPQIFLYYNELEFSIRARNIGYKILFNSDFRVIHTYSLDQRSERLDRNILVSKRRFINTFRSYFIYLYKNFNLAYFLQYSTKLILSKFYISIRLGFLSSFFITFFEFLPLIFRLKLRRNPVALLVQREYNFGNLKFNDIYVYREN